jgi:uncharacterized protein (TIGR03437 family)
MKPSKLFQTALFLVSAAAWSAMPVAAQSWDSSGNSSLQGTYYFRELAWEVGDNYGDLGDELALFGTITFDGNGGYTISGSILDYDSGSNTPQNFPQTTGSYSIASSGLGFLSSPISQGDAIYGLVSNGIFIGSSTEAGFNDLFIAAPIGAQEATNSTFQGTYAIADIDFPTYSPLDVRDAFYQVNPDGQGNMGAINVTGYIGGNGNQATTQTVNGAHYAFSNGGASITLGVPLTESNLIGGSRILYISPDGNFVFGGSANDWDMFVGVRVSGSAAATALNGLFYQAGVDEDLSTASEGYADLDSYYGSLSAQSGLIVGHQRVLPILYSSTAVDFTYSDGYAVGSDGSYDSPDGTAHYIVGDGGLIRIGYGIGPYLGINVAIQAPAFSGSGVFLNPTGVVNAASSAPFTAGLARGELITLYGKNLANDTVIAPSIPFPDELDNVQVMINGRPAPIYYVSSGQVSAIVPYATELTVAQVQVINNNVASNIVSEFMSYTAAGVFTEPEGGVGYAAALHPDYSLVTEDSPAQVGETVAVYLTGLGDVNPAISDGDAGPESLSYTVNAITATVGGVSANVTYAGLAPDLAGLYQINITIPSGVASGDVGLSIIGPDSYTSEATIPVGTSSGATAVRPVKSARFHASGSRRNVVPQVKFRRF